MPTARHHHTKADNSSPDQRRLENKRDCILKKGWGDHVISKTSETSCNNSITFQLQPRTDNLLWQRRTATLLDECYHVQRPVTVCVCVCVEESRRRRRRLSPYINCQPAGSSPCFSLFALLTLSLLYSLFFSPQGSLLRNLSCHFSRHRYHERRCFGEICFLLFLSLCVCVWCASIRREHKRAKKPFAYGQR